MQWPIFASAETVAAMLSGIPLRGGHSCLDSIVAVRKSKRDVLASRSRCESSSGAVTSFRHFWSFRQVTVELSDALFDRHAPPFPAALVHANGQALAYVYFEEEPGRRSAAHLLTRDGAILISHLMT